MSSTFIQSLVFASQEIVIYIGFFALISGVLGNTLNIIIFTSLKTFRETRLLFLIMLFIHQLLVMLRVQLQMQFLQFIIPDFIHQF